MSYGCQKAVGIRSSSNRIHGSEWHPSSVTSFSENEKRFILAEILKSSNISLDTFLSLISDEHVVPTWDLVLSPPGRTIGAAKAVFEDLMVAFGNNSAGPAVVDNDKLALFASLLKPAEPAVVDSDKLALFASLLNPVSIKRGRPTKEIRQAREQAAAALGIPYPLTLAARKALEARLSAEMSRIESSSTVVSEAGELTNANILPSKKHIGTTPEKDIVPEDSVLHLTYQSDGKTVRRSIPTSKVTSAFDIYNDASQDGNIGYGARRNQIDTLTYSQFATLPFMDLKQTIFCGVQDCEAKPFTQLIDFLIHYSTSHKLGIAKGQTRKSVAPSIAISAQDCDNNIEEDTEIEDEKDMFSHNDMMGKFFSKSHEYETKFSCQQFDPMHPCEISHKPLTLEMEEKSSNGWSSPTSAQSSEAESLSAVEEQEWDDVESISTLYADLHAIVQRGLMARAVLEQQSSPFVRELFSTRQFTINTIMEQFTIIFSQEWTAEVRGCHGEASTGINPEKAQIGAQNSSQSSSKPRKRLSDEEDGEIPDDKDGRAPKRPRNRLFSLKEDDKTPRFACPFRKHDPQKYDIYSYRCCALSWWDSISRVKEHLYRRHRAPIQCKRCLSQFVDQEALDSHLTVNKADICELQAGDPEEGITPQVERQLRSRKKPFPNQSEEQRWTEVYRLLFPNETVPSPYFEPVRDELVPFPSSRDLAVLKDFFRHELPRLFRHCLTKIVDNGTHPLGEDLKVELTQIVKECQERVFSAYVANPATSSQTFNTDHVTLPLPLQKDKRKYTENHNILQAQRSKHPMALADQPTPPQSNIDSPMMTELQVTRFDVDQSGVSLRSDSGFEAGVPPCACSSPCSCATSSGRARRALDSTMLPDFNDAAFHDERNRLLQEKAIIEARLLNLSQLNVQNMSDGRHRQRKFPLQDDATGQPTIEEDLPSIILDTVFEPSTTSNRLFQFNTFNYDPLNDTDPESALNMPEGRAGDFNIYDYSHTVMCNNRQSRTVQNILHETRSRTRRMKIILNLLHLQIPENLQFRTWSDLRRP